MQRFSRHDPTANSSKIDPVPEIPTATVQTRWLTPLVVSASLLVCTGWEFFRADFSKPPVVLAEASQPVSVSSSPPVEQPAPSSPLILPIDQLPPIPPLPPIDQSPLEPLPPPIAPTVTIRAVGDMTLGTNYPDYRLPAAQGKFLFTKVKSYLKGADLLFGNLEGTLTNYPYSAKQVSPISYAFRTPPNYAWRLREAGFNVLSVANNHSMDFFEAGFEDTIRALDQAGMKAVGRKNQILYLQVQGVTIAFIGFSYLDFHNSMHDLTTAKALVKKADQKADIIVISVHAGAEGANATLVGHESEFFYGENRGNSRLFARTMIAQGADLVLGHGPHVPRAVELYQNKLIAYSLGNFVGYETLSTQGNSGLSLILEAQLDRQGNFVAGKIIPVQLDSQGIPQIDQTFRTVSLMRQLMQRDFPETALVIDRQGQLLLAGMTR